MRFFERKYRVRLLEFVVAGILVDLSENWLVFKITSGRNLTLDEIGVALLIIVPFAVLTEIVIDHPRFWKRVLHLPEIKQEVKGVEKSIEDAIT